MRIDEAAYTSPGVSIPEAGQPMREAGRLIFVTNRGPIEHCLGPDGSLQTKRGAGGVVSGLLSASAERPVSWISVAMTEADRRIAQQRGDAPILAPAGLVNLASRLVHVPAATYQRYYDSVSNRLLWFAQHGMLPADGAYTPELDADWDDGYVAVNAALAEAVVADLERDESALVMFHDYHLYLAPAMVRAQIPEARLQHFIHIPWPSPETWARLPERIVRQIYAGLAANDVIGFQTSRDARNFLAGVSRYLPGARVSRDPDELLWQGRRVLVRAYPIALTPASVEKSARSNAAQQQAQQLRQQLRLDHGRKLLVRVDRVEPTKNIVRGFEAYERLLYAHPEWRERVVFLALLVPSRESLPEYRRYAAAVKQTIACINATYGTSDWQPIVAIFGNDRARALACMQDYDVLLVNPLIDGMNLVVKEGGLLNRRNGVTILSEGAGAYVYLRSGVLGINAMDVASTADALHMALTMAPEERARLAERLRGILRAESAEQWLRRQIADLMRVTGRAVELPAPSLPLAPAAPIPATPRLSYDSRVSVNPLLHHDMQQGRRDDASLVPVLTRLTHDTRPLRPNPTPTVHLPDAALLASVDSVDIDDTATG